MSIILFCLAMFENLIRYAGTFYFQAKASPEIVSQIYETTAVANIMLFVFFITIPIAARSAFHEGKLKVIIFLYRKICKLVFLTSLMVFFLVSLLVEIEMPWETLLFGMSLAWFGTAVSLLKAQRKLFHLSGTRNLSGILYTLTMVASVYFAISGKHTIVYLVLGNCVAALASEILIGSTPNFNIRLSRMFKWCFLILKKYNSLIIVSFTFATMINIDRITVANFADPALTTKYAVATSLSAPVIIMGNSFALTYFTNLLRRNPDTSVLSKLGSINLLSLAAAIISIIIYFIIAQIGFLGTRLPEFGLIVLVLILYALYANYQYLSFVLASRQANLSVFIPVIFGGMFAFYISSSITNMMIILYVTITVSILILIFKLPKSKRLER